jgi:hypothetical protein
LSQSFSVFQNPQEAKSVRKQTLRNKVRRRKYLLCDLSGIGEYNG